MPTSFRDLHSHRDSGPAATRRSSGGIGAPAARDLFSREARRSRLRVAERSMYGAGVAGIVLGWASPSEGVFSGGQGHRAVVALLAALAACLVGWALGWLGMLCVQSARRFAARV